MEKLDPKSEVALAWVAGFFAGEGSISITYGNFGFSGLVSLPQRKRGLLELAREVVIAHSVKIREPAYWGSTHMYNLNFNGTSGSELLRLILPYPIDEKHRKRAEIYLRMFPAGEHHVLRRAERKEIYIEWLQLRIDEKGGEL